MVEAMIALRDHTCQSARQQDSGAIPGPSDGPNTTSDGRKTMLHLDLKPANIFLEDGDGERPSIPKPIIGDFGIAETLPLPATYSRENGSEGWLPPVSMTTAFFQ